MTFLHLKNLIFSLLMPRLKNFEHVLSITILKLMIGKSLKLYVFSRLQDAITFTDTRNIIFHSETTKKLKSTSNPPLSPGPLSPGPLSPGPHLFTITSHVSETASVICNQAMYSVMHIQQNETHQVSIAPVHIIHLLPLKTLTL